MKNRNIEAKFQNTFLQRSRILFFVVMYCLFFHNGLTQPKTPDLTSGLSLNHDNWTYNIGEEVIVSGVVKYKGQVLNGIKINYMVGPEMMAPFLQDSLISVDGSFRIPVGTMRAPGFLRCTFTIEFDGKKYKEVITAAFNPLEIQPTAKMPVDFMRYWEDQIAENRNLALDPQMTLLKERSTDKVNVYEISFQNYKPGLRIYGILCVPRAEGRYPAVFNPPGAGIHKIKGMPSLAEEGIISLQIGIHGIPLNMDESKYKELANTTFKRYRVEGMEDRDSYYFKRVYLGCVRAIDFIYGLPQFDGENIAVMGGSQGGALTLVTTALDSRIKYLAAYAPALADLPGYLYGRAGGWPHLFKSHVNDGNKERVTKSLQYYDAVNFAKNIKVPGLYSWGYNDETTPPTTMFAVYNSIQAPKELFIEKTAGHWYSKEQITKRTDWLNNKLIVDRIRGEE